MVWDPVTDSLALQIKIRGKIPGGIQTHTFTLVGEEINGSPFTQTKYEYSGYRYNAVKYSYQPKSD